MHPESNLIDHPLIAIIGPTAVGKTDLVLRISTKLGAEIVSVDSMQVYRQMDIGTAKPSAKEQRLVRHHLVDIVEPDDEYNVQRFVNDAESACNKIVAGGNLPLLTGGTGLYLKALENGLFDFDPVNDQRENERLVIRENLTEKLADDEGRAKMHAYLMDIDPESASRIHKNDSLRMIRALEIYELTGITWSEHITRQKKNRAHENRLNILKIGLTTDREILYERINRRAQLMIDSGLIDEVKSLQEKGYSTELKSMQSIGYKHVNEYLAGNWKLEETIHNLARDTRHYAKRQFTWFNRDSEIQWFQPEQTSEIEETIKRFINQ